MNILDIYIDKNGVKHVIGTKQVNSGSHFSTEKAGRHIEALNRRYNIHVDFPETDGCTISGTKAYGIDYIFQPKKAETTPGLLLAIYNKRKKNEDDFINDLLLCLDNMFETFENTIKGKNFKSCNELRMFINKRNSLLKDELVKIPEIKLYFEKVADATVTSLVNINMLRSQLITTKSRTA